MLRIFVCLVALLLIAGQIHGVAAQTPAPAPGASSSPSAKPSRVKLTVERLKEMRAKWATNKPKLRACRKEVKRKGLSGDDRWFYIEECMERT
jgi:hypothetical protein